MKKDVVSPGRGVLLFSASKGEFLNMQVDSLQFAVLTGSKTKALCDEQGQANIVQSLFLRSSGALTQSTGCCIQSVKDFQTDRFNYCLSRLP